MPLISKSGATAPGRDTRRAALRKKIVAHRASLDTETRSDCAARIATRLWRLPELARCRVIACYFAVRGEADCAPIVRAAAERGKLACVPVLRHGKLIFAQIGPETRFSANVYGIPEPVRPKRIFLPRELDIAICPLVAFDGRGNRLGMGGGFYDRTFAYLGAERMWLRPRLIGIAYEFQKVAKIKAFRWDIPLHCTVTEQRLHRFGTVHR